MEISQGNQEACLDLLRDFRTLEFFATLEANDLNIYARALMKSCRDLDHARQVIEKWIENNRRIPTPADLHATARQVAENEVIQLPPACKLCRDVPGYVRKMVIIRPPSVFAGETRIELTPCRCARGRMIAAGARKIREDKPPAAATGLTKVGKLL